MLRLLSELYGLWRKFKRAEIVKVFSMTSISTFVKMLTGLISVKIVSTIIGPSGIALLGQLNNFSTILLNLASGGINNGITKYVAESKNDRIEIIKQYVSTAFRITLSCSLLMSINLILFHSILSEWIMLSPEYGYVFVVFGVTIFLYTLNNLLLSVLNGYKEFKQFVKINIVNSICGLIFTVTLVYFWELKGALISAVTFQSIMLFTTIWMARKLSWMRKDYFIGKFEKVIAKKYLHYSLMTFVSIATVPISQLILRSYVIYNISEIQAGWWEAMNRISGIYLMIITSSFGVYYLPRLSELKTKIELRNEIFKAYKIIIPILIVGFTVIYFLRFLIIRLVFTTEFLSMESLFVWQLIGDLFKISSWLLAFLMVAKSMVIEFVSTEIIFSAIFVFLGLLLVKFNGIIGLTQSYTINYFLYFLTVFFIFRRTLI
jgi:PST family polysaccharide transporter